MILFRFLYLPQITTLIVYKYEVHNNNNNNNYNNNICFVQESIQSRLKTSCQCCHNILFNCCFGKIILQELAETEPKAHLKHQRERQTNIS